MIVERVTRLFRDFFHSEKTSGLILIICSVFSLVITNTAVGHYYEEFWHAELLDQPLHFWINDGLMTIFFLLIGLEIERELYNGELSNLRHSLLPILAALGGMLVPAGIHFMLNHGTVTQQGFGIPMATDIAFSLAILSLLGKRVPVSLKIFLTALAIIDDIGAIIVIAIFYSTGFSLGNFALAMAVFAAMFVLNRLKVYTGWIYLALGILMWIFMFRSGIHPTISGVLIAFALPFGTGGKLSLSYRWQHSLHFPTALVIVPLFALANTAIPIGFSDSATLFSLNSIGILLGLLIGKPLGIFLFCLLGIKAGLCDLPSGLRKRDLLGAGILAGIGFTMSIFITLLAFDTSELVNSSKIAIISASTLAGLAGWMFLRSTLPGNSETNPA